MVYDKHGKKLNSISGKDVLDFCNFFSSSFNAISDTMSMNCILHQDLSFYLGNPVRTENISVYVFSNRIEAFTIEVIQNSIDVYSFTTEKDALEKAEAFIRSISTERIFQLLKERNTILVRVKGDEEGICPSCGSNALRYIQSDMSNYVNACLMYREYVCPSCRTEGVEWFDVAFVRHTAKEDIKAVINEQDNFNG